MFGLPAIDQQQETVMPLITVTYASDKLVAKADIAAEVTRL